MTSFSANLGFLWAELPLPDAICAAAAAGFEAVECHWPYDTPVDDVNAALTDTGLPMLGLNTVRGRTGENGLGALPGRSAEARAAILLAINYAAATGTLSVHVMAGNASGETAQAAFLGNLRYACDHAAAHGITILIEPLNAHDAPGYYLQTTTQALAIIKTLDRANLKLMFDCYHVQITEGDLTRRLQTCLPHIGHIQFATVPDRGPPPGGEIDYRQIFAHIQTLGYTAPLGAEYKPNGNTPDTLGWMHTH